MDVARLPSLAADDVAESLWSSPEWQWETAVHAEQAIAVIDHHLDRRIPGWG